MNNLDSFFSSISKFLVFVPVIIIPLALFFHFTQTHSPDSKITLITPTLYSIQDKQKVASSGGGIDLKTDQSCKAETNLSRAQALIKNNHVYAEIENKKTAQTTYFIFHDGCVYIWNKKVQNGSKICNVDKFISLDQNKPVQSPPIDTLMPLMNIMTKFDIAITDTQLLQSVLQSCKKQPVGETLFEPPKNIYFEVFDL